MRADIQMTESAQDYLSQVASNEGNTELRIGVSHPGTSLSQAFITFNKEQDSDDEVHQYAGFNLRYSRSLALFINGMAINYRKNRMGGNLHLKAPNIKVMPELPEDAEERRDADAAGRRQREQTPTGRGALMAQIRRHPIRPNAGNASSSQ